MHYGWEPRTNKKDEKLEMRFDESVRNSKSRWGMAENWFEIALATVQMVVFFLFFFSSSFFHLSFIDGKIVSWFAIFPLFITHPSRFPNDCVGCWDNIVFCFISFLSSAVWITGRWISWTLLHWSRPTKECDLVMPDQARAIASELGLPYYETR